MAGQTGTACPFTAVAVVAAFVSSVVLVLRDATRSAGCATTCDGCTVLVPLGGAGGVQLLDHFLLAK